MKISSLKTTFALTLAASAVAVALPTQAAPVKSAKGYQITPPTGWKIDKSHLMGTDLVLLAPIQNAYAANINVVVTPVPAGASLEMLRQQTAAGMPRMLSGFKMTKQGYTSVAGTRALITAGSYNFGTPARRLQMYQIAPIRGKSLFVFTHTSLAASAAKTQPAFLKAIASLKWTK